MVLVDELNLIWHAMGADLIGVEKIDFLGIGAHMELPVSEQTLSETVNRLVSLDEG